MTANDPKSDFLAAEDIKGILHGREKAEQERIIRWVSESLALSGNAVKPKAEHAHHATPNHSAEELVAATPSSGHRATDIRSFAQEKSPKNDIQFVAVAAYYFRFMAPEAERKEAITSAELQTAARLAQRPVFKAPSVTLNNSVQQGYMDRAGRGEYRLNAVGENLVAMTLPGKGSESTSKKRPSKRRNAQEKKSGKRKARGS